MPKYSFVCEKCLKKMSIHTGINVTERACSCGGTQKRQMPKIRGLKTTELVDKALNKVHIVDQSDLLKERKLDYYWSVEVPKMVESGTYTLETMLEQNWVYYNDKGELVTRTKPPQKT